jgi:hypothetical protein
VGARLDSAHVEGGAVADLVDRDRCREVIRKRLQQARGTEVGARVRHHPLLRAGRCNEHAGRTAQRARSLEQRCDARSVVVGAGTGGDAVEVRRQDDAHTSAGAADDVARGAAVRKAEALERDAVAQCA